MIWLQALLVFLFSVSNDILSVKWHESREKGNAIMAAVESFFLGLIAWASIIWVVDTSYWLMVPDLIGNVVGSYVGVRKTIAPLAVNTALNLTENGNGPRQETEKTSGESSPKS